jgi:hypothetical protein
MSRHSMLRPERWPLSSVPLEMRRRALGRSWLGRRHAVPHLTAGQ